MLHVLPFARDPKDPNDLVDPKAPEAAARNKKKHSLLHGKRECFYNLNALFFLVKVIKVAFHNLLNAHQHLVNLHIK